MSIELSFSPSFIYQGEIHTQEVMVFKLDVAVGIPGVTLIQGEDGREVELQVTATYIQWRYTGEVDWTNLMALSELEGGDGTNGREVEIQTTATHIQWRLVGDPDWVNLIALASLKGDPGDSPVLVAGDGIAVDNTDPLAPVVSLLPVSYNDLTDKPSIPDSPDDIGAATAAQGATADTAVQPGDLATVATTGQYSDLLGKPSIPDDPADIGAATAAQGALADTALQPADIGVSVASLVGGLVPSIQLPSFVDDVVEFADFAALPGTGETGKIYVLATPYTSGGITSSQFRWSGSAYAAIIASPGSTDSVTEGSVNLYFTTSRVLATVLAGLSTATSAVITGADSVLAAFGKLQAQITTILGSISNVDNTSDANKPVSTAQQTALDLKVTNPMTTSGDLIYGGTSGVPTRRAKGTNGQIFAMEADLPSWIDSPYVLTTTYDTDMGDIAAALDAILG
jgi:hypothetical protein